MKEKRLPDWLESSHSRSMRSLLADAKYQLVHPGWVQSAVSRDCQMCISQDVQHFMVLETHSSWNYTGLHMDQLHTAPLQVEIALEES